MLLVGSRALKAEIISISEDIRQSLELLRRRL